MNTESKLLALLLIGKITFRHCPYKQTVKTQTVQRSKL